MDIAFECLRHSGVGAKMVLCACSSSKVLEALARIPSQLEAAWEMRVLLVPLVGARQHGGSCAVRRTAWLVLFTSVLVESTERCACVPIHPAIREFAHEFQLCRLSKKSPTPSHQNLKRELVLLFCSCMLREV